MVRIQTQTTLTIQEITQIMKICSTLDSSIGLMETQIQIAIQKVMEVIQMDPMDFIITLMKDQGSTSIRNGVQITQIIQVNLIVEGMEILTLVFRV